MYPHVFPPHEIKGFWHDFFHPPLFCRIDKNRDWGESCGLKRLGERTYGAKDFLGGKDAQGHYANCGV